MAITIESRLAIYALVDVRELNLIPIDRLLSKYLSTGEGKRKRSKEQRKYRVLCAEVGPRLIMWPWQGFGP
jgi:hypothetical protein